MKKKLFNVLEYDKLLICLFKGIFIGLKSVLLFYINCGIVMSLSRLFIISLLFGLLNGFLDGIIVSIKSSLIYKIISGSIGVASTLFFLYFTLYTEFSINFNNYFSYDVLGAIISLIIFFGINVIISFPVTIIIISNRKYDKTS